MSAVEVSCPKCLSALPGALCNSAAPVSCPACDHLVQVHLFPACFRPTQGGPAAQTVMEEGVSTCFYHEQKVAVVHCDGCGRFLCALCDLEVGGQHLCPSCLQAGRKKGSLPTLDNRRTLYDSGALLLALLPMLFGPVSLFTAPLAIYLAILSFFRPSSIIPRTRIRAYLAIVLSLAQMGLWIAVFAS